MLLYSLLFLLAVDDAPLKGDLAKIQGTWTAKVGPEKNIPIALTLKGDAVTLKITTPEGQSFEMDGHFRLDEAAKPHRTIDWTKFQNGMGEDVADNLGIYTFVDDDTLRVCSGDPGNPRPTEFKDGDNDGPPRMIVLKREAKKDKEEKPSAIKGDLAAMQGEWTGMMGPEKNFPVVLTVEKSGVAVRFTGPDGQERTMKGELKVDDAAKPHKAVDWVGFRRPEGDVAPANLGIYKIEGDTLVFCNGGPGNDRPTEFKQGDAGPPNLIEFKRKTK